MLPNTLKTYPRMSNNSETMEPISVRILDAIEQCTYSLDDVIMISGLSKRTILLIVKEEGIQPFFFHGVLYFFEVDVELIYKYIYNEDHN